MQTEKSNASSLKTGRNSTPRKSKSSQSSSSGKPRLSQVSGLSKEELDLAFNLLSADKKTVTHNDVKNFIHTYFDWFPEEGLATLNSWKEEVSKEQLLSIVVDKPLLSSPHQTAFQWFKPDLTTQTIGKHQLKKLVKSCLSGTTPNKDDVRNLLNQFDLDRDGVIGFEDWKSVGMKVSNSVL